MITLNLSFGDNIKPLPMDGVQKVISALDQQQAVKIPSKAIINARIVDEKTVHDLNRRYGGKDESTDVLSFNYSEDHPKAGEELGDIVISYQHVQRYAKAAKTDENTELALLLLHGVLHILGIDHQNQQAREAMDRIQADVMAAAGLSYRDFAWKD